MAKNNKKKAAEKVKTKTYEMTGIFFPIPSGRGPLVSFATPVGDGFEKILYSIRPLGAKKKLLPKAQLQKSVVTLNVPERITKSKVAKVSVRKICKKYAPNSYVNSESLKSLHIVPENATYIKIVARGKLTKPLMIEAHEFSDRAVRMITLTGGRAIRLI